jgi:hypothetical protein
VKKIFLGNDENFILIDGAALMLEIIHNKHMNWTQDHQGVYLHFVYALERFLDMIMTLKKAVKVIFFKQIEDSLKCDPHLFLTYELMLFHLRNVPLFDEKLLFCESLDTYEASMKIERIAVFIKTAILSLRLFSVYNKLSLALLSLHMRPS